VIGMLAEIGAIVRESPDDMGSGMTENTTLMYRESSCDSELTERCFSVMAPAPKMRLSVVSSF